jgi:MFS family permease
MKRSVLATYGLSLLSLQRKLSFYVITRTTLICIRYLIGQAFGSILFPPLTECFGRKRTYICSALLYAMFCLVAALPNHIVGVIIGRFFSGFLSAIPSVVVGGSIEDMWSPRARIWAIQAWVAVSIMGLSIAPIVANTVSLLVGW